MCGMKTDIHCVVQDAYVHVSIFLFSRMLYKCLKLDMHLQTSLTFTNNNLALNSTENTKAKPISR